MFILRHVNVLLRDVALPSLSRVVLLILAVASVGFVFLVPKHGVSATVDYASNYRDVIGNAPFLNGPISIGGTNNLASHAENVYSSGNIVNINGGVVDLGIYGGYYNGTVDSDVASSGNAVTIGSAFSGSNSIDVYGGFARNVNAFSMTASDNTVTINGGTARSVYGGFAYVASMTGPCVATASGNTVNINEGTISGLWGGTPYRIRKHHQYQRRHHR